MENHPKLLLFLPQEVGTPVTVCDIETGIAVFVSSSKWLGVFFGADGATAEASWAGCRRNFGIIN